MVAIVNYGIGNLFSLSSSLEAIGMESVITSDSEQIERADRIILPGVGAFGDGMARLEATGLADVLKEQARANKKILGICLGMQLLFEEGLEYGLRKGLGLIPGQVRELKSQAGFGLKVPHMGWNRLSVHQSDPVFAHLKFDEYVYYVHSYYAVCADSFVLGSSEYGTKVPGVVRKGNVYGMQFHPEKSGGTGLRLLKGFMEL